MYTYSELTVMVRE
eukprot:Stramenopile-MAST_4_protein_4086